MSDGNVGGGTDVASGHTAAAVPKVDDDNSGPPLCSNINQEAERARPPRKQRLPQKKSAKVSKVDLGEKGEKGEQVVEIIDTSTKKDNDCVETPCKVEEQKHEQQPAEQQQEQQQQQPPGISERSKPIQKQSRVQFKFQSLKDLVKKQGPSMETGGGLSAKIAKWSRRFKQ